MKRFKTAIILALAAMVFTACAPLLPVMIDAWEHNDGGGLYYVLRDTPGYQSGGVEFDAGERLARGVLVSLEGEQMQLLSYPENASCTVTITLVECKLYDVTGTAFVGVSGRGVIATATWRREGGNAIYRVLARFRDEAP